MMKVTNKIVMDLHDEGNEFYFTGAGDIFIDNLSAVYEQLIEMKPELEDKFEDEEELKEVLEQEVLESYEVSDEKCYFFQGYTLCYEASYRTSFELEGVIFEGECDLEHEISYNTTKRIKEQLNEIGELENVKRLLNEDEAERL